MNGLLTKREKEVERYQKKGTDCDSYNKKTEVLKLQGRRE